MSPPSDLGRIAQLLADRAGYLRNVIATPRETCEVCYTPTDGYVRCFKCNEHANSGLALADRVAALVYASEPDEQTYRVMRGYKRPHPAEEHIVVVGALLIVAMRGHITCLRSVSASDDLFWAAVPSTRNLGARHPLDVLVDRVAPSDCTRVQVSARVPLQQARGLSPTRFEVDPASVAGQHILVIEDSWVTGSHAQSVAATMKAAGAAAVSILTVARVLSRDWKPSVAFEDTHLASASYDAMRCPWTDGACPPGV